MTYRASAHATGVRVLHPGTGGSPSAGDPDAYPARIRGEIRSEGGENEQRRITELKLAAEDAGLLPQVSVEP